MIFQKNTLLFKRIIILISVVIVSLILWNTYAFFQRFKEEERFKMEILAEAQKEMSNADLNSNVSLADKIITTNSSIPLILVDNKGAIIYSNNLDPIKSLNEEYLVAQLAIMKEENEPVEIHLNERKKQYIYYRNSDLLNKLTYYPLALLLILVLFLSVIYLFFNSTKIAATNKLWTGMAKETAHQIGTPLSSLLGWIAILKMEQPNSEYISEIEKDVYRLDTIANRFSKIGSKPTLKKENIVLATKKAFEYLKSRNSKHIDFLFEVSDNELFAHINIELFEWVIENLIKNAIDSMAGKGVLTLGLVEHQNNIKIYVTDTGKGISKKLLRQIFTPGFTTKKRGWGLGLSLSKRIVEDYHKGNIYVKSTVIGKGTTFEILLKKA